MRLLFDRGCLRRGVGGVACLLLLLVGGSACSDSFPISSLNTSEGLTTSQTTAQQATTSQQGTIPQAFESITLVLLDGSILNVSAPSEALGRGPTSHTVAGQNGTVVTVETGDKSFGTWWLAELANPQIEPYHSGKLTSGEFNGAQAFIWIGSAHSLLLAYDGISLQDGRAVLDALDIFEEPHGIVARGQVQLHQTTVAVPLLIGGGLEIEPAAGPAEKEMVVERGSNGQITSIKVSYPTANATVYIPPNRSGASYRDMVELIDVKWDWKLPRL